MPKAIDKPGAQLVGSTDGDIQVALSPRTQAGKKDLFQSNNHLPMSRDMMTEHIFHGFMVRIELFCGFLKNDHLTFSKMSRFAPTPTVDPSRMPVSWRFMDHPMPGTIFRLPDDLTLQRGITYTFLPDGRRIQVPSMNRLEVRASAQGHQDDEDADIAEALQQLLTGKRGKASFNKMGRAERVGARRQHGSGRVAPGGGLPSDAPKGGQRGQPARSQVRGQGMRGLGVMEA